MSRRIERLNNLIKEEVGKIILREIEFGNVLVTISRVDTSSDLRSAKIYLNTLPQKEEKNVLRKIKSNVIDLQQKLNKRLNMRLIPKIEFLIDKSSEETERVFQLLKEVNK